MGESVTGFRCECEGVLESSGFCDNDSVMKLGVAS